jgi:hypothetical protein
MFDTCFINRKMFAAQAELIEPQRSKMAVTNERMKERVVI